MDKILMRLMKPVLHVVSSWFITGMQKLRVKYRTFLQTHSVGWSICIVSAFSVFCLVQIFTGHFSSVPDGVLYGIDDLFLGAISIEPAAELFRRFARWLRSRGWDLPEATQELIEKAQQETEKQSDKAAQEIAEKATQAVKAKVSPLDASNQSA